MSQTTKRAFLIGINYKGTPSELGGCINDVLAVKELLIVNFGYNEDNILLLSDDTLIKPTASNILEGWRWLISKSPAKDFNKVDKYILLSDEDRVNFFFHYSGHGSQVRDINKDETDGKDETICPLDFDTAGMITDDIIRENLAIKIPSGSKLFALIDACHSESSFDLLWTVKSGLFGSFNLSKVGKYSPTIGDVSMLSGCQDFDTSADIQVEGKGQGALTYAFLQVLKKNNYNITYDKLLSEIRSYIRKKRLSNQVPCLSFGKSVKLSNKVRL